MKRTLALAWSLAVFVACSIPGDDLPSTTFVPFSQDKWIHLIMFFGIGWLWVRATPDRLRAVAVGGLAFAVGIEVWQAALPIGRSGDPLDALADAVGLALGMWIAVRLRRRPPAPQPVA